MQTVGSRDGAVAGILKYFKPPINSRGRDSFCVLGLIDDSTPTNTVVCVLFNPQIQKLPTLFCPGEPVMIKGLVISTFQGVLQGMGHENSLVGIFPMDTAVPVPDRIGSWYKMKDSETTRIHQLRLWLDQDPYLLNSRLEEMSPGNLCSVVCLVVAVWLRVADDVLILSVCDGTVPKAPVTEKQDGYTLISADPNLDSLYKGRTVPIKVSTLSRPRVMAGDIVRMENMFWRKLSSSSADNSEEVEFVLEDHLYHRGSIHVLSSGVLTQRFKESLPVALHSCLWHTLSSEVTVSAPEHTVEEILHSAQVNAMFTLRTKVIGIKEHKVEDLCHLECPQCSTRYLVPQPSFPKYEELVTSGDHCVVCLSEGTTSFIRYCFGFTILLEDHTGRLEVAVVGEEGAKFLNLVPVNLYVDSEVRQQVSSLLFRLTGGSNPFQTGHTPGQSCPALRVGVSVAGGPTSGGGGGLTTYQLVNTRMTFGTTSE